jgi:hypothetical protein
MVGILAPGRLLSRPVKSAGSPPTPGGASDVLLLANGTDGLLLVDGTSFLKLASSS